MPRKKYFPTSNCPYHITARCLNKEWFKIPLDNIWQIYEDYLFFLHHAFGFRIHSFVLMNNHYHMIVTTPDANLAKGMNYFQGETSRRISDQCGRINQIYGGPYYWSLLKSDHYYRYAYKYVYRNPVDGGLCKNVTEYKYSTLHSLVGNSRSLIPVSLDFDLFQNTKHHLEWLNQGYPSLELKSEIQNALKLKEFRFPKQKSREQHALDSILL